MGTERWVPWDHLSDPRGPEHNGWILGRSAGVWTVRLDGFRTSTAPVGHRDTAGLSTPAPWKRNHRLPGARDSGIGTGGTHGPGLTGESGVPEPCRVVGSCGVDASTLMSGGMDWSRGRWVSRYSPIMDGQPSQSPPRMVRVDPGGVDPLIKTPGMGVKGELTSPQGAGVPGTVISPGRPNLGLGRVPASVYQHSCP